jgi:20S proteasome alpha/beta subunit
MDMTLCIAATCINDITDKSGQPTIVLGADTMVTAGAYSSETGYKRVEIGPYVALFSGTISEAHELLSAYSEYFAVTPLQDPLSSVERLKQLRQPLEDHKWRKLDHLMRMRLGMGYTEFLERGDQIDSQVRMPLLADIWALSVEVELLVAGITPGPNVFDRSFIFRLTDQKFEVHKNFACIGEGASAAEQSLHRRKQSELTLLSETLYNVYEAKKMGELARSVGEQTMLAIVEPDDDGKVPWKVRGVTAEAKEYLDGCFANYGPKLVSQGAISFRGDIFVDGPNSPAPPPEDPPDSTAS